MSKIKIPLAETEEAEILQSISVSAFKDNFENFGHYPPGIELVEWHQGKIKSGNYHKIQYDEKIVGGLYVTSHTNKEMKIEYLFISPEYQDIKIGAR